jgi:hypothetical protein
MLDSVGRVEVSPELGDVTALGVLDGTKGAAPEDSNRTTAGVDNVEATSR